MITAEISGFGGGYEIACQPMLKQGVDYLTDHPNLDPQFHGFKGLFGICMEDNADAKALTKAVLFEVPGGPTGAMHQAVIGHLMRISQVGWDRWLQQLGRSRQIEIPFETAQQMREYLNDPGHRTPTQFRWPKVTLSDKGKSRKENQP